MKAKLCFKFTCGIVLSLFFVACNQTSVSSVKQSIPTPFKNIYEVTSKGGNYTIIFSPATANMPLNEYFDMEVYVRGQTKQVLDYSLELQIDAGMKTHNHGMNISPNITALGKGKFKVEGMLFHMPGNWFLRFLVSRGVISDKAEINLVITQ